MKNPICRQFVITWIDAGCEPQCPPDPRWPNGIDLDISQGRVNCCTAELPYPAKRIGRYMVYCTTCNQRVACSTAGRLDDPRSLTMACRPRGGRENAAARTAESTMKDGG